MQARPQRCRSACRHRLAGFVLMPFLSLNRSVLGTGRTRGPPDAPAASIRCRVAAMLPGHRHKQPSLQAFGGRGLDLTQNEADRVPAVPPAARRMRNEAWYMFPPECHSFAAMTRPGFLQLEPNPTSAGGFTAARLPGYLSRTPLRLTICSLTAKSWQRAQLAASDASGCSYLTACLPRLAASILQSYPRTILAHGSLLRAASAAAAHGGWRYLPAEAWLAEGAGEDGVFVRRTNDRDE